MLKNWMRRRAVRRYHRIVGPELRRRHGVRPDYTPDQILGATRDRGVSTAYDCYALAMFASPAVFASYHADHGRPCDYGAMRAVVATTLFDGDATFTAETLTDPVHSHSPEAMAASDAIESGALGGHDAGIDTGSSWGGSTDWSGGGGCDSGGWDGGGDAGSGGDGGGGC